MMLKFSPIKTSNWLTYLEKDVPDMVEKMDKLLNKVTLKNIWTLFSQWLHCNDYKNMGWFQKWYFLMYILLLRCSFKINSYVFKEMDFGLEFLVMYKLLNKILVPT
jgi:hypothetical protein